MFEVSPLKQGIRSIKVKPLFDRVHTGVLDWIGFLLDVVLVLKKIES